MGVYSAVIFDVDGVLFNTVDSEGNFLWSKTVEADFGLTAEDIKGLFGVEWLDVIRGKLETKQHFKGAFKKIKRDDITVENFIAYWLEKDSNINSPLMRVVQNLELPLYIATNQDSLRTAHLKNMIGGYFQGIFSSSEIGFMKPETGFYKRIEEVLKIEPSKIFFVDDTLTNVEAAKAVGWSGLHFTGNLEELKARL